MLYKHLSENLKTYRKKVGLTQKALGEKILKSEISIRKYESGNVNIPPSTLFDLCDALNISSTILLGEDKDKYFSENFGTVTPETNLDTERALLVAQEYRFWGESFRNEVDNIESKPDYLLGAILKFLENTEEYYTAWTIHHPEYERDKHPELPYFTDNQINSIISKITELVKYEIYKLENNIK